MTDVSDKATHVIVDGKYRPRVRFRARDRALLLSWQTEDDCKGLYYLDDDGVTVRRPFLSSEPFGRAILLTDKEALRAQRDLDESTATSRCELGLFYPGLALSLDDVHEGMVGMVVGWRKRIVLSTRVYTDPYSVARLGERYAVQVTVTSLQRKRKDVSLVDRIVVRDETTGEPMTFTRRDDGSFALLGEVSRKWGLLLLGKRLSPGEEDAFFQEHCDVLPFPKSAKKTLRKLRSREIPDYIADEVAV